jgi:hypothetical protein
MGKTTFSGPIRVGAAQKTTNPEFAGAVALVAWGYIPDATAAATTEVQKWIFGSQKTGKLILPSNSVVYRVEVDGSATGGTNPTFNLGFVNANDSTEFDVDGIVVNGDADADGIIKWGDATAGNDLATILPSNGTTASADPVIITGGVGNSAPTGGNIAFRIYYFVWDFTNGTDGSAQ